jgi:hypothetical protein
VTNESYENPAEHHYVVTLDDMTGDEMAYTCPHHVHRSTVCKHMAAVETATDDGTLTAFPSDDDETDKETETAEFNYDGLDGFPCWPCVRVGRNCQPNSGSLFPFMPRQMKISDVADQRTLTECADAANENDDTPTTKRALLDRV